MIGDPLSALLVAALPTLGIAFWWTGARARELAVGHARLACRREGVQFLDQSVALARVRPARSARGTASLAREFSFEFTHRGEHRDVGRVLMNGPALVRVVFPYTRDEDGNRVFVH